MGIMIRAIILLMFTSLWMINVQSQFSCSRIRFECSNYQEICSSGRCNGSQDCSDGSDEANCPMFQEVPGDSCLPCGGSTQFNCTTIAIHPLGRGNVIEGVGGQLWKIEFPNGSITTLISNTADSIPVQYEFISPTTDEYTGIMVFNTNSRWNGTTFQCIAFTPANEDEKNDSAAAVTLEVGGLPQSFSCRCWCPSDKCTIMWERLPTVSCNSLTVNVSVTGEDGTLAYSGSFNQSIIYTETNSLNTSDVYTTVITAGNICGSRSCSANCSLVREKTATLSPTPYQSPPQTTTPSTTAPPNVAGPVAGGVISGLLVIAIIAIVAIAIIKNAKKKGLKSMQSQKKKNKNQKKSTTEQNQNDPKTAGADTSEDNAMPKKGKVHRDREEHNYKESKTP